MEACLRRNGRCLLADEMGCGKTVQASPSSPLTHCVSLLPEHDIPQLIDVQFKGRPGNRTYRKSIAISVCMWHSGTVIGGTTLHLPHPQADQFHLDTIGRL